MTTEQQHLATVPPRQRSPRPATALPPDPPAPLVIPQGVQLVLLLVGLLALWVAARAARSVVEIVVVASLIALILNPFVSFLNRRGLPRGFAIPLTYLTAAARCSPDRRVLAQPISNQVNAFQHNVPISSPRRTSGSTACRRSSTSTASTSSSRSRARPRSRRSRRRC
jgi:lysylphosphatidylglycerol synthetase-like protein (DUF2156 family)